MPTEEYEYTTVEVDRNEFVDGTLSESLDRLSAEGWEVIDTVRTTNLSVGCILRREV